MKYIVKNCPCYTSKGGYYDCWANQDTWCENVTNCVIKQVIEKCKRTLSINKGFENEFTLGKMTYAEFILKDFDIEEINK